MKLIDKLPEELLNAVNDFSAQLEWARRLPLYEVHKWWARRYSGVVRLFLIFTELNLSELNKVSDYRLFVQQLYESPPKIRNKKLLDPFSGGGTILIEGSILGYDAHGIEINKLPCLFLEAVKEIPRLDMAKFEVVLKETADSLQSMWRTKCDLGHDAVIIHTFLAWRRRDGKVQIKFNKIKDGNKKTYFCENCGKVYEHPTELDRCVFCNNEFNKPLNNIEFHELYPYALEFYCPVCNRRSIKSVREDDVKSFHRYNNSSQSLFKIPELDETRRLLRAGFKDFGQLLTRRQYITFKTVLEQFRDGPYNKLVKTMVSDALRACSLLAYYSSRYMKVVPGFVIKSYWMPPQPVELNPISYWLINGKVAPLGRGNVFSSLRKLKRARNFMIERQLQLNFTIYNGAAQDVLPRLKERFDIIFTDPPYADYQYYSDLSLFSLSLIGELTDEYLSELLSKEIVLRRKMDVNRYQIGLYSVFNEAVKKMKEDGRIIVTFHHPNEEMLYAFLSVFKNLPVKLHAIYPVIGESSGKLVKRRLYLDLIFVFGKSKQSIHYVFTKHSITPHDEKLQKFIVKLVEFYEE